MRERLENKINLTVMEVAEELNLCHQRIRHKIKQGHFLGVHWCECGHTMLIPRTSLEGQIKRKKRRAAKKN